MPAPSSQRVRLAPAAGPHRGRRPLGAPTRGKTAAGRLRQVDALCALYAPELIRRRDGAWREAPFVDLGYGARPDTTLESALRLRRLNPELPVLGVEIDPERVAAALSLAGSGIDFRLGGFELPLAGPDGRRGRARLVRAFNVLRQYEPEAVLPAWQAMAEALLPGGLIVEGSADPSGSLWVANLLRRGPDGEAGPRLEALVFGARLRDFVEPAEFRAVLPKQLIHGVRPGEPIQAMLEAWQRASDATAASRVWGPRRHFVDAARLLAGPRPGIDPRRRWLARGLLIWRRPAL